MAVIAKQRYKLDIAPKGGWVIVYASQHDDGAREIEFEITNQGNAFSIPASINVSVQGIKSNKSYFSHSCSYSGNVVTMALADDMTDVIGKAICVLKFTNSSQQKLATAKFILNVDSDSSSEGVIIDTEAEEIFNQMLNEIRAQASAISVDIAELQSMVGSPLVASTASAMTNHNKIYVYTGSESGYTNGNWYYWNGSVWTSGGVYNSNAFETDKTLSVENMPADAKVVGGKISELKEELSDTTGSVTIGNWVDGYAYVTPSYVTNVDVNTPTATSNYSCQSIPCSENDIFYITGVGASGAKLWVWVKSNGDIINRADSNTTGDNLKLTAPTNAAYLLVNVATANPHKVIKNEFVTERVDHIEDTYQNKDEIFGDRVTVDLAGMYWGVIGSGTTLQVRSSTTSYNGIKISIPADVTSVNLSDMVPYSVQMFINEPFLYDTVATTATVTNKIVKFEKDNPYKWILVTLRLSDSGNDKNSFVVSFNGKIDNRISAEEDKLKNIVNGKNIPIVCLIYDDNTTGDSTLYAKLNERGLKGTFSTIGNANPTDSTWKETAENLQKWVAEGHGILGHGLTRGVDVTILTDDSLAGITNISDADARKAIEANNNVLDFYDLPHNGIAYWNVWEDTPHSRNIVEKYYNYGFTFGGNGAGINTLATDKFRLTRYTTDSALHITPAIELLRSAVGQKCMICFGGHMSRTGTGTGDYSTMEQFESLLDEIQMYVDAGVMVSLNTDDAVKLFYGDSSGVKNEYPYLPTVGQLVYDNGLKYCSEAGDSLIVRVTLSGTPSNGHITIPVLQIDVDTYSTDTLNDIIVRIVNSSLYDKFTVVRTSRSQCFFYSNKAEATDTPSATVNTSGLTISFRTIKEGKNPVWV